MWHTLYAGWISSHVFTVCCHSLRPQRDYVFYVFSLFILVHVREFVKVLRRRLYDLLGACRDTYVSV